jgi:ABC-type nitrate/sulfonate/bicarbonate transport system substrate-binding protein
MKQITAKPLKRHTLAAAVIMAILAITVGSFFYLNSQQGSNGKTDTVTVGMEPNQVNLLVYIAENQNYFAANCLNVTIKDYASGSNAVDGLLKGDINVAMATEFVVTKNAMANQSVQTIATTNRFLQIYVVGRKDRGVLDISDLANKKTGLSMNTAAAFYRGRFLELNRVNSDQASLLNVPPSQIVDALANGTVDAVVTWQPYVKTIEDRLGNNVVKWPAQSGQAAYMCAIGTNYWIDSNPNLVKRFLNALHQAEEYVIQHPTEAKTIAQYHPNSDAAYIETVWSGYRFSLSLNQALILAMQDEAQWLISSNLTNSTVVPNFLNYIYVNGLEAINHDSVNIIR